MSWNIEMFRDAPLSRPFVSDVAQEKAWSKIVSFFFAKNWLLSFSFYVFFTLALKIEQPKNENALKFMKVKNGKRFECMQASIFPMMDFLPNFPYGKICILCQNPFPLLNLLKIETSPEKLEKRQKRKKRRGIESGGIESESL